LVLATGGGVVMDPYNVKNLRSHGVIIYLEADAIVLHQRLQNDQVAGIERPSLSGEDPLKEIDAMLKVRTPLYTAASDFVIQTAKQSPEQIVFEILDCLKTKQPDIV
jgi:shikimate kinase